MSINSIKWLIFMMQTQCVYCEAEAEFLNLIQMNFMLPRLNSVVIICLFTFQSECVLSTSDDCVY